MRAANLIPAARVARIDSATSPRRFGAMVTGAAAAVAVVLAMALPAKASPDAEDYLKTIIGLAIIGAIADAAKDDGRHSDPRWVEPDRHDHYKPVPESDKTKKKKKKINVPATCAIEIDGKRRDTVVYTEGCLRRVGLGRDLPYQCSTEAKIKGRWSTVFPARCLRSAGYNLLGYRD